MNTDPSKMFQPLLISLLLLLPSSSSSPTAEGGTREDCDEDPACSLRELFSDYFRHKLESRPEMASLGGFHEWDHKLSARGVFAAAAQQQQCEHFAQRAKYLIDRHKAEFGA